MSEEERSRSESEGTDEEIDPFTAVRKPSIRLDQFLKWQGLADTGGQAKLRIQCGDVKVNGMVELRRGRTLHEGDRVEIDGSRHEVPPLV